MDIRVIKKYFYNKYGVNNLIDLNILKGLSFHSAELFLNESGYVLEEEIRRTSEECDVIIIYCYFLYHSSQKVIDKIGFAEYCNYDEDGELDDFKWEWVRLQG